MSRRGRRGVIASSRRRSTGGTIAVRTTARGNDEATGNNATSVITVPGTVQNGDVLLVVAGQNTTTATFAITGGGAGVTWNTRRSADTLTAANLRTYLFSGRATGTSAGSTITVTATDSGSPSLARFPSLLVVTQNATDTGIVHNVAQVNTVGTAHAFPSVTVPSPGGFLLLGLSVLRVGTSTPPTFAAGAPAGATLDDESNTAAPAQPNLTASGLHKTATVAAGSQTPGTATSAASARSILYTIALAPA